MGPRSPPRTLFKVGLVAILRGKLFQKHAPLTRIDDLRRGLGFQRDLELHDLSG